MVKYGKNNQGKQRWFCKDCGRIELRKRKDVTQKKYEKIAQEWLEGYLSLNEVAEKYGTTRQNLTKKFSEIPIRVTKGKQKDLPQELILVVDAKEIEKDEVVLIVYEYISQQVIAWSFQKRENYASWFSLFVLLKKRYQVKAIVSDGQKGLQKAIFDVFSNIIHQRCIFHVMKFSLGKLTRKPKTEAGKDLRNIVLSLSSVYTEREAFQFQERFLTWERSYASFLKEKSINPLTGRKWYTHKSIRSVRSHLKNSLPFLFYYVDDETIPRTTNNIEGGTNSSLDERLRRHRGIQKRFKRLLVSLYLLKRRKE